MQQYTVTGMHCAACSASVEKAVKKVPGVTSCAVSLLTNSMGVEGTASPETVITAYASPCRFIAATSMSSANRVLPLRGAPATNVASSRSSTSIMSPQLSRTVRLRIAYHRPKPS